MNKNEKNFRLDWILLLVFLITIVSGFLLWLVIPNSKPFVFAGIDRGVVLIVHLGSGFLGLLGVIVHIVWHWDWLKALRGRRLSGMPKKLRANRVVDRIMWITYIATNVFGAIAWVLHFGDDIYVVRVPDRLHVVFGIAWTILAIAHLALHWKWITSTSQRCIVSSPSRSSQIQ